MLNQKIKNSLIFSIFILIFITIIQYIFVYTYLKYLNLTPDFIKVSIGISVIFFLNLIGFYFVLVYRKQKDKEKLNIFLQSEQKKIEEISYFTRLDKFKNNLISMNRIPKITGSVNKFLMQVFEFKTSKIYLWKEEMGTFISYPEAEDEIRFFVFDPFLLWVSDHDKILTLYEIQTKDQYRKIKLEAERFFETAKANVFIPLILNQSLIGFTLSQLDENLNEIPDLKLQRLYEVKSTILISISNAIFYARTIALTENLEQKVKERTKALEEAQSQLILSEKMASLGVMVAGIAHEINTPAGVINGSAENMENSLYFLLSEFPSAKDIFTDNETIIIFSEIMNSIINESNRSSLDSKERFKLKKEIRERLQKENFAHSLIDDVTVFIVENNLLKFESQIISLIEKKGNEVLSILKHGNNLDRNLKNIKFGIKNIVRIVRALKYYSHLDQASFADANLIEGIENILIILHNQIKHGIEIEKNFQPISLVPCNLDELNQVWTNLLQNAAHAMKGKGIIKISTYEESPFVALEIEDNGSGIPPENIDRIWDPFFTTKDQGEGTGLGLGIVKGIIEKHKGKISVKSKPGQTVFKILLPSIHFKKDIDAINSNKN